MFLTDCLQVKEFKEWTQEYKNSTCFQFHSNVLQVHPSSTSRTSEKLHEIFAGFADRTRAAGVRGLKACVGEVFLSRRRACGLSFSSSCKTAMESLAKRSKQDFELSRTVPKGFIRSYRFSPGNYVVDVPSLFQEIFQLLISLMITQLEHMQFKVSVSVQVKRKCVIDKPILAWTLVFPFVQAELSRDDGELASPYFRSRQKIVLSEGDIESAIESCQTDIQSRLDSWVCFLSCVCSFTIPLWFCFWFFIFLDFEWIELKFKTYSQGLRWFRGVQTLDGKQLRRFATIHQVKEGGWKYFECILLSSCLIHFFSVSGVCER